MPSQRDAEAIIADWRAVLRDLEAIEGSTGEAERLRADSQRHLDEGADETQRLRAEIERLRDEYQRLVDEARDHGLPAPPPFPPW